MIPSMNFFVFLVSRSATKNEDEEDPNVEEAVNELVHANPRQWGWWILFEHVTWGRNFYYCRIQSSAFICWLRFKLTWLLRRWRAEVFYSRNTFVVKKVSRFLSLFGCLLSVEMSVVFSEYIFETKSACITNLLVATASCIHRNSRSNSFCNSRNNSCSNSQNHIPDNSRSNNRSNSRSNNCGNTRTDSRRNSRSKSIY